MLISLTFWWLGEGRWQHADALPEVRRGVEGVSACGVQQRLTFFVGQRAFGSCGRAQRERARRNVRARGDDRSGSDNGTFCDHSAVHDDGAHADEATGLDVATVDDDPMAQGDVVVDDGGVFAACDMDHGQVLDIDALTNADLVDIATDDAVEPDGAALSDVDIADDNGPRGKKNIIGQQWMLAVVGQNQP